MPRVSPSSSATAGFDTVISRTDLVVVDFKPTVCEFLQTAEGADIAVVYYAGRGIEIGGTNYLVPIDAKLSLDYRERGRRDRD